MWRGNRLLVDEGVDLGSAADVIIIGTDIRMRMETTTRIANMYNQGMPQSDDRQGRPLSTERVIFFGSTF
jgi:hypothetical protein